MRGGTVVQAGTGGGGGAKKHKSKSGRRRSGGNKLAGQVQQQQQQQLQGGGQVRCSRYGVLLSVFVEWPRGRGRERVGGQAFVWWRKVL